MQVLDDLQRGSEMNMHPPEGQRQVLQKILQTHTQHSSHTPIGQGIPKF